ncbi:MAG: glycosyltransferase family 4 protein [Elusimicrobia bacterium]|nr:glycosyltransferase family 4 protein [Elusimicrobiota bacterium]
MELRLERTPDGAVWTRTPYSRGFWDRYLEVFESVRVVARVLDVPCSDPGSERVDGERVTVHGLPYYVGPWEFARRWRDLRRAVQGAVRPGDAVIMRVGSPIADLLQPGLAKRAHPYGVEVVGDPWEAFGPGAIRHPLRPFFRRWFARNLRRQCRHASAGCFVTRKALQDRYPLGPEAFCAAASDIDLLPEHFAQGPRSWSRVPDPLRLVFVGSLEQVYKAPDVLISAMARLRSDHEIPRVTLDVVGDGRFRASLEEQARTLGLRGAVRFHGHLPAGDAVRRRLDAADLFVLPSRAEGLPRAMVEAMARAMPCIGSDAVGIPELIDDEDRVPAGSSQALAAKIADAAASTRRLEAMSARNFERARDYAAEPLRRRRTTFYEALRASTAHRRAS